MKKLLLAALMLLPLTTSAQAVIGTDPNAATAREAFGGEGSGITQTFRAAGSRLNRLSIWFWGGRTVPGGMWYFSTLYINKGPLAEQPAMFSTFFDQTQSGRVDFIFDEPLKMTEDDVYSFSLWTNNGDDAEGERCAWCTPIGDTFRYPEVEITAPGAYADGAVYTIFNVSDQYLRPFDVRFEAEFTDVPEPTSAILLLTGLVPIYYRVRKGASKGVTK